ncbi:MAG: hypothetical protein QOF06_910 [Solirubrobacterales bacterium]|jgi:hypothetical protein|nr:hypothetical protein [Solirubrobacterales bacterium]
MKARGLLGVLACALAALLLPAGAAADLPKGAISLSSIKLGESNGYEVELADLRFRKRRPGAGEGFTARLCPSLSILSSCLPKHERARIGSRYGSGSHSQPLALTRLSSLR